MNYFEKQLRTITATGTPLKSSNWVYAGRAAFLPLSGQRRARLEFVTCGTAQEYEALKVTIINTADGRVDDLTLRFADYFAPQKGGCSGTVIPHIWVNNGKEEWYKTPTSSEIKSLAQAAHNYIAIFA